MMKVTWTIELDAGSPLEAAKLARELLLDPGAECVVFEVDGQFIDLLEIEDHEDF